MKGTCIASLERDVAILVASATFLQSISQNLALTVVVKLTQSLTKLSGVLPVTSSHWALVVPPVMEQSNLRVGVSPLYWLIIPLEAATGTGMVRVIGLWNFRLRGSMVTIGDTATRLPSSLAVSSEGIGWAWRPTLIFLVSAPWGKTAWTWGTTVELTTPPSGPMA